MAGTDRRTGKLIGRAEHIKQSIEVILTTPTGTRVMRLDFGNGAIRPEGGIWEGLSDIDACAMAKAALQRWEPRAIFEQISPKLDGAGLLLGYSVTYRDSEDGLQATQEVSVMLPGQPPRENDDGGGGTLVAPLQAPPLE